MKIFFTIRLFLIFSAFLIFAGCKTEPPPSFEIEKEEVRKSLNTWTNFISRRDAFANSKNLERFNDIWVDKDESFYVVIEKDEAIIGSVNIYNYFEEKNTEFDSIEYSLWNPTIWISPTKSEAAVIFYARKKIKFKNGFVVEFDPIRTSSVLLKFGGEWKFLNVHESIREK